MNQESFAKFELAYVYSNKAHVRRWGTAGDSLQQYLVETCMQEIETLLFDGDFHLLL